MTARSLASEALVDHALGLNWAALPDAVQTAAKAFLYDSVCVGAAGAASAHADQVFGVAAGWGTGDHCPILGRPGTRLPAASAAFVNAFQIHGQEFDCAHEAAVAHPLATVLAALLAKASGPRRFSGADLLSGLVAGVDVVATLGLAPRSPLKFFRPATAGVFGSVAAIARLQRLPKETARDAFGHALAFAAGTMQAHVEGKPALPLQVGNAARAAVTAVDFAVAGIPGCRAPIEGPFGYLALFEDETEIAPLLGDLGRIFRIAEVSWKPFPTGRAAHGAIVAIQGLRREHGVSEHNLARFVYTAPPLIRRLVGRRPFPGMAVAHARLCLPWLAAVALRKGAVGLEDFEPETLRDPALHALTERIIVEESGEPDPAAFTPASAVAELVDGRRIEIAVTRQFGSPAWPLSLAQQREKGLACLAFAGLSGLEPSLAALIERFDHEPDAAALGELAGGGQDA